MDCSSIVRALFNLYANTVPVMRLHLFEKKQWNQTVKKQNKYIFFFIIKILPKEREFYQICKLNKMIGNWGADFKKKKAQVANLTLKKRKSKM